MTDASILRLGGVMKGRVEELGDVISLALEGDFDLAGAEDFSRLMGELEARRQRAIVVDLAEVTFLDSTGARLLFEAQRRAGEWRFAVVNGRGPAHRALTLTGLGSHLEVVEDVGQLDGSV
jgi:anti-sigma B factor antagonist